MLENHDSLIPLKSRSAVLLLENGEAYWGQGIGAKNYAIGELCFNTSQTGYQEILTDPSYASQIITFTFPHIGIVGTNKFDVESLKIHACGCVLNQPLGISSSWRSNEDLDFFFTKNNIACITGVDTRQLTRLLASKGAMKAAIINYNNKIENLNEFQNKINKWKGLKNLDLAKIVSTNSPYKWNESVWNIKENKYQKQNKDKSIYNIVCIDFGIKKNILRNLNKHMFKTVVLPAQSSLNTIMSYKPQGIFLSNGPGDPFATGHYAIPTIKKLIKKQIPIFGICLGHQVLSLALGGKTKKMFQGHRGGNHPVKNMKTKRVEITCQNHGFEVDRESLPSDVIETHISLFDQTNEGIEHKKYPVFSVQYHPEASPGPHDSHYLFEKFYKYVDINAKKI